GAALAVDGRRGNRQSGGDLRQPDRAGALLSSGARGSLAAESRRSERSAEARRTSRMCLSTRFLDACDAVAVWSRHSPTFRERAGRAPVDARESGATLRRRATAPWGIHRTRVM